MAISGSTVAVGAPVDDDNGAFSGSVYLFDTAGNQLAKLTASDFQESDIQLIRDPPKQVEFGVPESALKGHAFHTYTLTSPDGSVQFAFQHNVCGRRMYADGTADAVAFLADKARSKAEKKMYNMIDVLKMGGI